MEKRSRWRYRAGDLQTALQTYGQAIELLAQAGDEAGLATAYNNIAFIYQAREDWTQCPAYFEQSLAILEAIGARAGAATVRQNPTAARAAAGRR